jgi:hypothetical protein
MIGEKCRHEIWNEWLDGYAATTIARYALDGETNTPVSPAMVRRVIADGPPDTLLLMTRVELHVRAAHPRRGGVHDQVFHDWGRW